MISPDSVRGIAELGFVFLLITATLGLIWHYATRQRRDGDPFGIG
jgi:hypothetical protein